MTNPLFDLSGKTALITGSSQGIGLALAHGLADAGVTIILNGRTQQKLDQAALQFGGEVHTSVFDVTDSAAVTGAIDGIESEIGPVDILVNNAGMQIRNKLDEFADEDWQRLMRTNLDSVYYVSKAVARYMIAREAGKIVNIASVNAKLGRPGIAPYTASKGAIVMLTQGMCADWAQHNIQINSLAPGYFDTELTSALVNDAEFTAWLKNRTPSRRWGDVKELQGACVFLCSPGSSFVNGHTLYVDGGIGAVL
ncbi:MAG: SDR family NAD(P)-dependent oxidoreductase [Rhizobiaceae bacterium]